MDAQLKRGVLEVCVLAAMKNEAKYGYQLVKEISPYVEIAESTLYPILKRLEANGLVDSYLVPHQNRIRKYYRITEKGRKRIAAFLAEWEQLMRAYRLIQGEETNDKA